MPSVIIFILLLLMPSIAFGGMLQQSAYERALFDVNVVIEKTNRNDHPRIDQYLRNTGVPLGSPYCTSGVYTWYKEGAIKINTKNPLPKTAGSIKLYTAALSNPMRYKTIKPKNVMMGSEKLQLGDIATWESGGGFGHTGFIVNQIGKTKFKSIEANTSFSSIASEQREQSVNSKNKGGVYYKIRGMIDVPKFKLLGFFRVR